MNRKGYCLIYSGYGKGKTTAALGLALRFLGHGKKVCVIQFIKSVRQQCGEHKSLAVFGQNLELHILGEGFVFNKDEEKHKKQARSAFQLAQAKVFSSEFELVILDEISWLLKLDFISLAEVIELIEQKPSPVNIVLTGRDMPEELYAKADLVTIMEEVKHPLLKGEAKILGIDY